MVGNMVETVSQAVWVECGCSAGGTSFGGLSCLCPMLWASICDAKGHLHESCVVSGCFCIQLFHNPNRLPVCNWGLSVFYFQMNTAIFRDKLNPESNICMGLGCQSFKITKQNQNQTKNNLFRLVAGIWCPRSCNGFCQWWKRFGSAYGRDAAFSIQGWRAKWSAIRSLLFYPSFPQGTNAELCVRVKHGLGAPRGPWGPPWDRQGRTLQVSSPHPSQGAGQPGAAPSIRHFPGDGLGHRLTGGSGSAEPMAGQGRAVGGWNRGPTASLGRGGLEWGPGP